MSVEDGIVTVGPRKGHELRAVVIRARVTPSTAREIDTIALRESRSQSDMVRMLLHEALTARRGPRP